MIKHIISYSALLALIIMPLGSVIAETLYYSYNSNIVNRTGTYKLDLATGNVSQINEINPSNMEFMLSAVPIPATVWLFGSGLIGLFGVARRKVCDDYNVNQ